MANDNRNETTRPVPSSDLKGVSGGGLNRDDVKPDYDVASPGVEKISASPALQKVAAAGPPIISQKPVPVSGKPDDGYQKVSLEDQKAVIGGTPNGPASKTTGLPSAITDDGAAPTPVSKLRTPDDFGNATG